MLAECKLEVAMDTDSSKRSVLFVDGVEKMFSLVTDLQLLRAKIEEIGNVVLVIIDPMSAYLGVGKVDGRSATDVRGVLSPLKDMAEELHIAVIGIAHFNKKDDIKSALLRVSDSIKPEARLVDFGGLSI
jgi:AAA domain